MDLGNGLGHLTYSTLVHPADNWKQLWDSLQTFVPKVKARVSPNAPFGVCIRLAAPTADLLTNNPAERRKLKQFLADQDMYVYTANAFPYGAFKGTVVKEQVYEPDWRTEARTLYTMQVADILAEIGTAEVPPSIQTAPLGFKPNVTGPDVVASYTEHVLRVAAHLVQIEARTGRLVTLAIEPEPHCFLETTDETVDYFTNHLYTGGPGQLWARGCRFRGARAPRRHPASCSISAIRRLRDIPPAAATGRRGIRFSLRKSRDAHPRVTQAAVDALPSLPRPYLCTVLRRKTAAYQVLESRRRLRGLDERPGPREWRTHSTSRCSSNLGAPTTRFAPKRRLGPQHATPLSRQLEIGTYTWDVPDHLKIGDIVDYVARDRVGQEPRS